MIHGGWDGVEWRQPRAVLGGIAADRGLAPGENFAGVFVSTLSDKEVMAKVEQWAHARNWDTVTRTGDDKIVAVDFDSEKDPAGAVRRGMAAGHMRSIGVEAARDHKFSLSLNATSFKDQ